MELQDRVSLVTGSATGVGREAAIQLARRGSHVVVNYTRSEDEARETVAMVEALGRRTLLCRADVSDDAQVRDMVTKTLDAFGRLDVLVNNAGTTSFIEHSNLEAVTDEVWDRILAVNLKGAFYCMRAAAKPMIERGEGAIVNVSSVAGLRGGGSSIPYAASKGALNTITMSMARVLAPAVRVNTVCPGFIEGRWLAGGLGANYETARKRTSEATPLKGVATPAQVASVIVAIVAEMDWVTGEIIAVDGGSSVRL